MTDVIEGMARAMWLSVNQHCTPFALGKWEEVSEVSKGYWRTPAQAALDYLKQPQTTTTAYNPQDFARLETAYLALLGLPHGYTRLCLQPILAGLRDHLAAMSGVPAEAMQNQYERRAAAQSQASKPISSGPTIQTVSYARYDVTNLAPASNWDPEAATPSRPPEDFISEGQGPELSQEQIEAMKQALCPACGKPLAADEFYRAGYEHDNYRTIPPHIGRGRYCDHKKRSEGTPGIDFTATAADLEARREAMRPIWQPIIDCLRGDAP